MPGTIAQLPPPEPPSGTELTRTFPSWPTAAAYRKPSK
jgi:hypothetical protein